MEADTPKEPQVKTSLKPLGSKRVVSKYNIEESLKEKKVVKEEEETTTNENLARDTFTNEQVQQYWKKFLLEIAAKDQLTHFAINGFKLNKISDDTIQVNYPSTSAKKEFEKVSGYLVRQMKQKFNNDYITLDYHMDVKSMKKEVLTRKKIFEEWCEKNPLLNDLNDFFKFDLN